jgi:hypothetical protein
MGHPPCSEAAGQAEELRPIRERLQAAATLPRPLAGESPEPIRFKERCECNEIGDDNNDHEKRHVEVLPFDSVPRAMSRL